MSEAAKILIEKANQIRKDATTEYDRELDIIVAANNEVQKRYDTLTEAAKEICDHQELSRQKITLRDGRDEEEVIEVTCATCGMYIKTEH